MNGLNFLEPVVIKTMIKIVIKSCNKNHNDDMEALFYYSRVFPRQADKGTFGVPFPRHGEMMMSP